MTMHFSSDWHNKLLMLSDKIFRIKLDASRGLDRKVGSLIIEIRSVPRDRTGQHVVLISPM